MIRGIFGKKTQSPAPVEAPETPPKPAEAASGTGAAEDGGAKTKRPWDGQPDEAACNFAVGHLFNNLPAQLKQDERVHTETCLTAIGAIAGFAAQRALFAELSKSNDQAVIGQLQLVTTRNGAKYFLGEPLNRTLVPASTAEVNEKLWSLAASGAIAVGLDRAQLPSLESMFAHVSKSIGGELDGLPSVPKQHHPKLPATPLLKLVWPLAMMCFTGRFPGHSRDYGAASIKFWPAIAAHVANALIRKVQPVLDPRTSLLIVMETAIYASKLDAAVVKGETQLAEKA